MPPMSEEMASVAEGGVGGRRLSREECLCPVCMEIFLEPVTLPCEHTFCKPCFLQTVDKASMCCPLCRKRVSTWARLHSRKKTLVNDALWREVQEAFPLQCERRISGELEDKEEEQEVFVPKPTLSEPGALRKEYEDQISKLQQEKRAEEEEERRASEEYIQKLLAEEEEHQLEERKRKEEDRQLEDDERLARTLSLQLNSAELSECQVSVTSAKKKQKSAAGQIERFLCPLSPKPSAASCSSANKENILNPHSRLDLHGGSSSPPSTATPSTSTTPGPDGGSTSIKRKSSQLEATASKRVCLSEPAGSFGLVHQDPGQEVHQDPAGPGQEVHQDPAGPGQEVHQEPAFPGQEVHQEHAFPRQEVHQEPAFPGQEVHQEPAFPGQEVLLEQLQRRRQQEEQDRHMALLLQKKLNQEAVRIATDRSKGSADPYQLRHKTLGAGRRTRSGSGAGAQDTPAKRPNKTRLLSPSSSSSSSAKRKDAATPSSSPSPSSSSPHRGSKQVTLTEMFPNLGH